MPISVSGGKMRNIINFIPITALPCISTADTRKRQRRSLCRNGLYLEKAEAGHEDMVASDGFTALVGILISPY